MRSGNNSSAEYTIDPHGRRVLRGLTFEETRELEYLDAIPPFEGRLVCGRQIICPYLQPKRAGLGYTKNIEAVALNPNARLSDQC